MSDPFTLVYSLADPASFSCLSPHGLATLTHALPGLLNTAEHSVCLPPALATPFLCMQALYCERVEKKNNFDNQCLYMYCLRLGWHVPSLSLPYRRCAVERRRRKRREHSNGCANPSLPVGLLSCMDVGWRALALCYTTCSCYCLAPTCHAVFPLPCFPSRQAQWYSCPRHCLSVPRKEQGELLPASISVSPPYIHKTAGMAGRLFHCDLASPHTTPTMLKTPLGLDIILHSLPVPVYLGQSPPPFALFTLGVGPSRHGTIFSSSMHICLS